MVFFRKTHRVGRINPWYKPLSVIIAIAIAALIMYLS